MFAENGGCLFGSFVLEYYCERQVWWAFTYEIARKIRVMWVGIWYGRLVG